MKYRSLALEYEAMLQELLSAAGNPLQMDSDGYPNRRRLVSICILVRELLRHRAFGPMHSLACTILADLFTSVFVGCNITKELLDSLASPLDPTTGIPIASDNPPESSVPLPFSSMEPFFLRCRELDHLKLEQEAELVSLETRVRELMEGEAVGKDFQRRLRIEELEKRVNELELELAKSKGEVEVLKRDRRSLMDGMRMDVKSLTNELKRTQQDYERMAQELRNVRAKQQMQNDARRALASALGVTAEPTVRASKAVSAGAVRYRIDPDAERLLDQLYTLQNNRMDKYDVDLELLEKDDAVTAENKASAQQTLQEDFLAELEALQSEIIRLKSHIDEVRKEKRIAHGRTLDRGLLRPDELVQRGIGESNSEDMPPLPPPLAQEVSSEHDGSTLHHATSGLTRMGSMSIAGPLSHSKLWSGYVSRCASNEEVVPKHPRLLSEERALQIMFEMVESKMTRDMNPMSPHNPYARHVKKRISTVVPEESTTESGADGVGGGVGGGGAWKLLERGKNPSEQHSLSSYLYQFLFERYGHHVPAMANMYAVLTSLERHQSSSATTLMMVQALSGDLDQATLHCCMLLARSLRRNVQRLPDIQSAVRFLYHDLMQSDDDLASMVDEWSEALGADSSIPRLVNLLVTKLLNRHEARYARNLKMLRHVDNAARNALGLEEFTAFVRGRISVASASQDPRLNRRIDREARLLSQIQLQFAIAREFRCVGENGQEVSDAAKGRGGGMRVPLEELAMAVNAIELDDIEMRRDPQLLAV